MVRQTSREAYNAIKENGLLSKRRLEVYEALYSKGPMTANETFREIAITNGKKATTLLSVSNARFTELRNAGVVREVRERKCSITGVKCIEWDVTDNLPVTKPKIQRPKCPHCNGTGFLTREDF